MDNLSIDLSDCKSPSKSQPPVGNYKMVIKTVEKKVSKQGNDMLVLAMDVAEGPYKECFSRYPRPYFMPFHNDSCKARMAEDLQKIIDSNPGELSEEEVFSKNFDPQTLAGKKVGAKLRLKDGRDDLIIVGYLCEIDNSTVKTYYF
ncbi:MAG: DUF669 domain-containing protein [PVC group bacterium]|nr:DUF669 domain-containing protein [PVC group bacterium]